MATESFNIGDTVIVRHASNASLNLYMKAKQAGLSYIKCPCNAKTGQTFEIKGNFLSGFMLKGLNNGLVIVAHASDMRRIHE